MRLLVLPLALLLSLNSSAAFSTTPTKPKIPLKGISASQFRHPLDQSLTSLLQNAPFHKLAEEAIRSSLSLIEQGTRLDLLSSAVKVSPGQLPELHEAMQAASQILDLSIVPELYVQSSSQANAYTLAFQNKGSPPIVVVTSALIERCTNQEIQAILGHELGHIQCSHSLYLTLGGFASAPLRGLPVVGSQTERLLQQWRLAAEYSCDRAAMLVAQDVHVVTGAMLKLFGGTSRVTNTRAFVEQAYEYERLWRDAHPIVRILGGMQRRTHPLPVRRVVELERWADSEEYKKLLSGS